MPIIAEWKPEHAAVWREVLYGEDRAISLRHPTYPAEASWRSEDPAELVRIAAAYLAKVSGLFGLPDLFESDGTFRHAVPLAWLPVDAGEPPAPRSSFFIKRRGETKRYGERSPRSESGPLVDRTAVLFAVEAAEANRPQTALGSRLGIRIVAQIAAPGPRNVRIAGASCSIGLPKALGPHRQGPSGEIAADFFGAFFSSDEFKEQLKDDIRAAARLDSDAPVWIDGLRVRRLSEDGAWVDVYANVPPPQGRRDAPALAVTAVVSLRREPPRTLTVEKFPLIADAAPVETSLFLMDPASEAGLGHLIDTRPNRSPQRLEPYRHDVTLPGLTLAGGQAKLLDDLDQVKVTRSRLVKETADEDLEEIVDPDDVTGARVSPFAALSGYHHARSLFDTLRAYGLEPVQYFRFAAWPLLVRYRARIRPGPGKDGKTVNAQVSYYPADCDIVGTAWDTATLKPLQIRFALADLRRTSSRREPLGLTADPRWSWHEYCHVLLAASTGALEFRFAHSAGDALAALMFDPLSKLARADWPRGYTFPWVYLHRRHDRSVHDGWSWSGRYHRPARFDPGGNNCRHKGYQSEQILSTSLFRLYRALGGDTVLGDGAVDVPARQAAADYTAYLVIRAIGLAGGAMLAPPETPDQFVWALIEADIGTWPVAEGPLENRVGGCAHKVVRWAFEAQGLYATTDPLAVIDAPGLPPDVDVFIDSRRPDCDGDFPRGGYEPVSLDWHAARWHASDTAIQVTNGNEVLVEVRNRGRLDAGDVTVQVWWIEWPANTPAPDYPAAWTSLGTSAAQTVGPWPTNPPVQFGPFAGLPALPPESRLLILAGATCADDRANNDPATGLPSATVATPIVDLVAGDNNLALRLHIV